MNALGSAGGQQIPFDFAQGRLSGAFGALGMTKSCFSGTTGILLVETGGALRALCSGRELLRQAGPCLQVASS
jgi:hypothetical protein